MIAREQVADLREGDVVEVAGYRVLHGATVRGPLRLGMGGSLCVGVYVVRMGDGGPADEAAATLTVVSRAPRPLYVNSDRTEPVPGDVVRDADDDGITTTWFTDGQEFTLWCALPGLAVWERDEMPARLRLLVDGETGQVVP